MKTIIDINKENDFVPNGDWEYEENEMDSYIRIPRLMEFKEDWSKMVADIAAPIPLTPILKAKT
jgi:hypothetical protein